MEEETEYCKSCVNYEYCIRHHNKDFCYEYYKEEE